MEEFNRGIYDYIIATDEVGVAGGGVGGKERGGAGGRGKGRKRERDREYGVCRGVDFQGVENVVNFDLPPTPDAYIHRVGRSSPFFLSTNVSMAGVLYTMVSHHTFGTNIRNTLTLCVIQVCCCCCVGLREGLSAAQLSHWSVRRRRRDSLPWSRG